MPFLNSFCGHSEHCLAEGGVPLLSGGAFAMRGWGDYRSENIHTDARIQGFPLEHGRFINTIHITVLILWLIGVFKLPVVKNINTKPQTS